MSGLIFFREIDTNIHVGIGPDDGAVYRLCFREWGAETEWFLDEAPEGSLIADDVWPTLSEAMAVCEREFERQRN